VRNGRVNWRRRRIGAGIRNVNREMVGESEGVILGFTNFEVCVVEGYGNERENGRVVEERGRKKEAINTRRPGERGIRVICEVEKGVLIVRGVEKIKSGFEGEELGEEEGRRKRRRGRGGVGGIFDEIQVTANKSINRIVDGKKRGDKRRVEGVVMRFKVDI
jgi:hypothetical protein